MPDARAPRPQAQANSTPPRQHAVVMNDEEQYSIWPVGRDLPAGWRADGFTGTEEECLAYIEETWTDMRPASLRRWMLDHEQAGAD